MFAVARAEIAQRLREPGFLFALLLIAVATTLLAPGPYDGYATFSLGDRAFYPTSNFYGTSAGIAFGLFGAIVCIFLLGGGFARDERSRFAEVLRGSPVATANLIAGRVLACWTLALVVVSSACFMLAISLAFRFGGHLKMVPYVRSFFILALPATLIVASLSVTFDIAFGRIRGLYVALALTVWLASVVMAVTGLDIYGVSQAQNEVRTVAGTTNGFSVGLILSAPGSKPLVRWDGIEPTHATIVQRVWVAGLAVLIAMPAFALYRRRSRTESQKAPTEASDAAPAGNIYIHPVAAHAATLARQLFIEGSLRVRSNRIPAVVTAAITIAAPFAPLHLTAVAALFLPLLWIRTFDDATRAASLDELLSSLSGGISGDVVRKGALTFALCALPLVAASVTHLAAGLALIVPLAALACEVAWLVATVLVFRAELLGLALLGLAWYVVGFNRAPAEIDYMGVWFPSLATLAFDAAAAAALVMLSAVWLRRRT